MFNIDHTPVFRQKAIVTPPGGTREDFIAVFEALDVDAFAAFDLADPEQVKAFLDRVLVSVDDIVGKDDEPMPDSPDLRARLINKAWVRQGLVTAYLEGHRSAQAGN